MQTMADEEVQAIDALLYVMKIAGAEVPTEELLTCWRRLSPRHKKIVLMTAQVTRILFSDKIPDEVRQRIQVSVGDFPRLKVQSQPPTLS